MDSFSYQQKIAMMRILIDIINADGRIDARETSLYEDLKKEFKLHDNSHEDVENKNSLLALAQIKNFTPEQKEFFSHLMTRMIVVDEDIDANEVDTYNVVCDYAGISPAIEDLKL